MAHLTGGNLYPHETSVAVACSSAIPPPIPLGTRARDAAGNEYMYVDFDATKSKGEVVQISAAFLAADIGATTKGVPLGVVCGSVSSSDLSGWVQIYGVNTFVLSSTGTSPGPCKAVAVSGTYSYLGRPTSPVNVFVRGAYQNTTDSTASSLTGTTLLGYCTMTLNYPFITGNYQGQTSAV
jgi:hypothetical protein